MVIAVNISPGTSDRIKNRGGPVAYMKYRHESMLRKQRQSTTITPIVPESTFFEPIEIFFPKNEDYKCSLKEARDNKNRILQSLPPRARKENPNFLITGQSCARGLGSIYRA